MVIIIKNQLEIAIDNMYVELIKRQGSLVCIIIMMLNFREN